MIHRLRETLIVIFFLFPPKKNSSKSDVSAWSKSDVSAWSKSDNSSDVRQKGGVLRFVFYKHMNDSLLRFNGNKSTFVCVYDVFEVAYAASFLV